MPNDDPNLYARPLYIVAVAGPECYVIQGMSYDQKWADDLATHLRGPDPVVYAAALDEVVVERYFLEHRYQCDHDPGPGAFRVWQHHGQTDAEWLPWGDPTEPVREWKGWIHAHGATVAIAEQRLEDFVVAKSEGGGAAPTPPVWCAGCGSVAVTTKGAYCIACAKGGAIL